MAEVRFDRLEIGEYYERPFLARMWGYRSHQALSRGAVTPKGAKCIILFVTHEKQESLTQYDDYIDGDLLFWEGEKRHGNDRRIVEAKANGEEIHLFYRKKHHSPFIYYGPIELIGHRPEATGPSKFTFRIGSASCAPDALEDIKRHAHDLEGVGETEREAITRSRIGQGRFRQGLIKLWGGCSVTGLWDSRLLRASHAKPWRDASNSERLDPYNGLLLIPNFDGLFNAGLVSFEDDGRILVVA